MVAVGRYTDNLPSIVNMSRAMADGWGGCSEEDLEEFAREDGVDPLELADAVKVCDVFGWPLDRLVRRDGAARAEA